MIIQRPFTNTIPSRHSLRRTLPHTHKTFAFSDAFIKVGRITELAHGLWKDVLESGDIAIDATCGNGHDSLYLAQLLNASGTLLCFDIQSEAIHWTKRRMELGLGYSFTCDDLKEFPSSKTSSRTAIDRGSILHGTRNNGPGVLLIHRSHETMEEHVTSQVKLVCFNLGYLPGGNKEKTTMAASTLSAVEAAMRSVKQGGWISIVVYPGHPEGLRECVQLRSLCSQLSPSTWVVTEIARTNCSNAPFLLTIFRRF